jgi:hypothetical protein
MRHDSEGPTTKLVATRLKASYFPWVMSSTVEKCASSTLVVGSAILALAAPLIAIVARASRVEL